MPIVKPQGLKGLQGLGSLSKSQYDDFINRNKELISQHNYDPVYINNLYSNKQFIDKYGIEKFKAIPDIEMRNALYKDDIVNTEFNRMYNPVNLDGTRNNKKGLGADFEKYNQLSTDAKLQLMESNYLTPSEFEAKWQKDVESFGKKKEKANSGFFNFLTTPMGSIGATGGMYNITHSSDNEMDNESAKQIRLEANQKILDKIYNDDVDNAAKRYSNEVADAYYGSDIAAMSDSQVKQAFIQAIKGDPKKGDLGIPEFESHYGNGTEEDITSEMQGFTIDDMRQVLAKRRVYYANMSPEMTKTALNNDAKRYITEHQGSAKRLDLFMKDVGISAMSYSADKLNGIAELYRMGQDALAEKPIVMVDDRGNIIDPNKTKVIRNKQGKLYYQDADGQMHSIHQEQVDYTTLHNMGKNTDGSDIEGAFGVDWMTLNPQYWTRAEQYGTLDEAEQKQYEKIGSSPYKVAYNPNEEGDLWYESFKMMSFGLADAASQLIPYGVGLIGKTLSTASKVGKVARGFGKVLDTTGKLLTAETKVGQFTQGTAGALGIAYAYNRGAFQETLQQNLANAEEAVMTESRNDIYEQYHNDKKYKAGVDNMINARAAKMKEDYVAQMQREGGMQIADEKALDKMLHAKAQDAVLGELVQKKIQEKMSSQEYADLQQKAIDGAGDAAFNTFWPEALKYGFVNNFGYRKFLYTNPAGLAKKVSSSLKGLKEITTSEGKKRMSVASKFKTRADKWKEFGKTLGSQAWGGAWTNGTDDMQVDAAERINEDSFNRYLNAYRTGEALADTYGFIDGMYSYMKGLQNSMGQSTTLNAATVGALGSVVNFTPNFANIARLATKEGREAYKNNFYREVERDENNMPLRNEDGSMKYKELGKGNDWRGQLNYFIQNGVLNTYYGKKQSERDLQSHADYVNNILEEYKDFDAIEQLVASNIASENMEDVEDEKTMKFIKALHAVDVLNKLGESANDPTTMSSVIQNAKEFVKRASQLNEVDREGNSPVSEEEIKKYLSEYYAAHPEMEQNEYNSQKALYTIAQNAQKLQEASEAFDKAEEEIQKLEKTEGKIDPDVRTKMKIQQALDSHWRERKEKMRSEIDDPSDERSIPTGEETVASVGGMKNAQNLVKVYNRQEEEMNKELEEQHKKTEELNEAHRKAYEKYKAAKESGKSDDILKTKKELDKAEAEASNSEEQEKYIKELISKAAEKRELLEFHIENVQRQAKENGVEEKDIKDKILTADEIFALDPELRARMLNEENRDLYSEEQQREIEKLEKRLLMKDADALQKVQDIAMLSQRIDKNSDAYIRMSKNPKAAAVELEKQRMLAANAAYRLINYRNAEAIAKTVKEFDEGMKGHTDVTEEQKNQFVFKMLRRMNSNLLDLMDEEAMLPQYQQQLKEAKEWNKTVVDIASVISESDKDDAWKENALKNIDTVVEKANNKAEIIASLEKVIDDTNGSITAQDFEYILQGMEKQGYQRDATVIENRKQRLQRREVEKKKREEEKKKIEAEAKEAAEKEKKRKEEEAKQKEIEDKAAIERAKAAEAAYFEEQKKQKEGEQPQVEVAKDGKGTTSIDTSTAVDRDHSNAKLKKVQEGSWYVGILLDNEVGDESITVGDMWNAEGTQKGRFTVTKKGNKIMFLNGGKMDTLSIGHSDYEVTPETGEHSENAAFEAKSLEKRDEDWYFIGNFAGTKEQTEVKAKKDFDIDEAIERQQNERKLNTASKGVNVEEVHLFDDGDSVQGKSLSIEEQAEESKPEGKEEHTSDTNEDAAVENGIGESTIETSATTLSGNSMSEYVMGPLKEDGTIEKKKGKSPDDKMSQYYNWMNAAGIKLQNIIDHELARIIKRNPNAKVKFMAVKPESNATNDVAMQSHLMLVLDYDNSINKNITNIHDDSNGGVIESNGKKYLIIGVLGFGNRNASKLALYDILWGNNPKSATGYGKMRIARGKFFRDHPTERFYVNEELSTEIVPASLIPGYIVRRMENDAKAEYRSVSEILADESRNPHHYDFSSLSWGIQELSKFLIIGASPENVMIPRNPVNNSGTAFVLMPASNGKMVPSYLKVLKYTEMRDGALKDRVDGLLQEIVSPNYRTRYSALLSLTNIFLLNKDADNILLRKTRNEISLVQNGKVVRTFVLDSNFNRDEFMKAIEDMNPRINVTASVLRDEALLREYDEAGALMTDVALFGTAGSSYSVYGIDGEGKMTKPEQPSNDVPKTRNSDFRNENRKQIIYKRQYYIKTGEQYYLEGNPITDEKLIKQLQYNERIIEGELLPVSTEGVWEYYILNTGENPEVVKVDKNTKEVKVLPEEKSKELIEKIEEEQSQQRREKAAEEVLKAGPRKVEDVDLGIDSFTVDPNTGEMVPVDNTTTQGSETEEAKSSSETTTDTTTEEKGREAFAHKSTEGITDSGNKAASQTFTDLMKNREYSMRVLKLVRSKWKEAPKKMSELADFLKGKNVEVEAIGTSKEDVEAWIKTIEDCR